MKIKFIQKLIDKIKSKKASKILPPDVKNGNIHIQYIKNSFKNCYGYDLDLNNPQTLSEKMMWIRIYDNTPLKTKCADKYEVREYIKEKIGEEYLIPLLGVYDNFDEIDFDNLPNQFVLKCNHGCGYNIIVRNKNNFERTSMWLAALIVLAINFPQAINTICLSPGKHDAHTPPPRVFVIPPMPSCTQTSCTQTSASCFNNCYIFIVSQNCLPPYM